MVFGQTVEDNRRHRERFVAEPVDVGVKREQTMLTVDGPEDSFALGYFEAAHRGSIFHRLKRQLLIAGNNHGAWNRRQVARLTALLVVLHQFVDFSPDDLSLISFFARRNSTFQQIPIHFRLRLLLAARHGWLARFAVAETLEPNELVDIPGGKGGLIKLHA